MPNAPQYAPEQFTVPPKKRRTALWISIAAVVVVAAVVTTILLISNSSSATLTVDKALEKALLTSSDFPSGYDVSVLTQDEIDKLNQQQQLPDDIQPAECSDLMRSQPKPTGDYSVGGMKATNAGERTGYSEIVTPVGGYGEWNPSRIDEVIGKCGTTTFSQDGQSGTVSFAKLTGVNGDGFALRTRIEGGGVKLTLGVAITKVGEHVVVFTGAYGRTFDEASFVRLANAANEKARATL
ncbi:hypothetical protein EV193_108276 [Herbihabitans rhizosphaerae]|uniref:PknH-like protein n=2 Tax=Herbihabitans rhizosphaerae TaxID=1872711 RepID=A0A4Q7KLU0_9PSEU|nr:hypothetical protein EV193_108276 [Herbihabitans rhizosphaerae]